MKSEIEQDIEKLARKHEILIAGCLIDYKTDPDHTKGFIMGPGNAGDIDLLLDSIEMMRGEYQEHKKIKDVENIDGKEVSDLLDNQ